VATLLRTVLASKPKAGTHWSVRGVAEQTGISKSTVQRYLALFGVQPHRSRSFTLSTDPLFVEKVRDIAGLYLNPPDKALVLCVDEKSQIQALERTQPAIPTGLGYVEGSRTATSGTGPPRSSQHSTSAPARSSRSANGGTATRSSSPS
jgi:putative transposase